MNRDFLNGMVGVAYDLDMLCRKHNARRGKIRIQLPREAYELLRKEMSESVHRMFNQSGVYLRDVEIYPEGKHDDLQHPTTHR